MITYWLRVHCRWVLVTTTRAVWAATPRWTGREACRVAAGALAGLGMAAAPLVLPRLLAPAVGPFETLGGLTPVGGTALPVPEPATWTLVLVAVIGLVRLRRRG